MQCLLRVMIGCLLIGSVTPLTAVVPDLPPCMKEIAHTFFDDILTQEALSMYQVSQSLWIPILQGLHEKSKGVEERMKRATASMVPNPIEYPLQKEGATRILKEVLFEIWLEVLNEYGVGQQPRATYLFNYLWHRQLGRLVECFGPAAAGLLNNFE